MNEIFVEPDFKTMQEIEDLLSEEYNVSSVLWLER